MTHMNVCACSGSRSLEMLRLPFMFKDTSEVAVGSNADVWGYWSVNVNVSTARQGWQGCQKPSYVLPGSGSACVVCDAVVATPAGGPFKPYS